jgi:hypothetical protein
MATFVQGEADFGTFSSSPLSVPFTSNVTAGNTIIVMVTHSYLGCAPTVTDSQSNTYSPKGAQPTSATGYFHIFTAVAGSTGACTVTITFACGNVRQYYIVEASGLDSDPYEDQATQSDTTSPYGAGDVTTTVNNSLILSMWNKEGSDPDITSVSSPMTLDDNTDLFATAYGILASAGNVNPEVTGPSGTIVCFTAAFKATAGGGGGNVRLIGSGARIKSLLTGLV